MTTTTVDTLGKADPTTKTGFMSVRRDRLEMKQPLILIIGVAIRIVAAQVRLS